jgi:hypothetical protein
MLRRFSPALGIALSLVLVAGPAGAATFAAEIPLADGWQPEGIAVGRGLTAYVGSLADGGIARVDLRTGERDDDFVTSATGPAVGLEYEPGADRLWVAGGPSGEVRVYDATTGALLETYAFGAGRFVNDVVVTRDAAYATDSSNAELLVVPLTAAGTLPAPSDVETLALGGDWVQVAGFNANGIEAFAGWLFVVNSTTGALDAVNPATGEAHEVLEPGSVIAGDGILFVGSTLYVVQNQRNLVSIWSVRGGLVVPAGQITEDELDGDLDVPTTIASAGGSLWAANARFTTPAGPGTAYWITRIPLH